MAWWWEEGSEKFHISNACVRMCVCVKFHLDDSANFGGFYIFYTNFFLHALKIRLEIILF